MFTIEQRRSYYLELIKVYQQMNCPPVEGIGICIHLSKIVYSGYYKAPWCCWNESLFELFPEFASFKPLKYSRKFSTNKNQIIKLLIKIAK